MPKPNTDTISALNAFRNGNTQRWTAAALGLDDSWRGTVHRILHGYEVGRDTENTVRLALGLPALPRITEAIACPTCGIVHGEGLDCGGNDGDVLWVKPDQRIVKQGKPRKRPRYWRPCLPATLTDDQKARIMAIAKENKR